MAFEQGNKGLVLPYEEEEEAVEESPTSYLRHLKEISYILEKLQSNRARFLLAAAHRRRHQLGSFAAKQRGGEEGFPFPYSACARQDDDNEETNLQWQYMPARHEQWFPQQNHEKRDFEHQNRPPPEEVSLDVEIHSDFGSISPVSDIRSHTPAVAQSEAEVSDNVQLAAAATTTTPSLAPAAADVFKRNVTGTFSSPAAPASDIPGGKGRLPAATAVNCWEDLDSSVKAPVIAARTSSHLVESRPSKRESILQRAPLTKEGDDLDLYLGALLVPLLHDGLVKLCRLIELKQNDKSKKRLGAAFHEQFNPLRWLGQYLIRHHPEDETAQAVEVNRSDEVALVCESVSGSHHEKEPVSIFERTRECSNMERGAAAPQERTSLAAEPSSSMRGDVEPGSSSNADTQNEIAETAHASFAEATAAEAVSDPGFLERATTPANAVEAASPDHSARATKEQRKVVGRLELPGVATDSPVAAATASNEKFDAQGSVEGKVVLAGFQVPTTCHMRESLHRRRMQQHASFYGVLKDIVDEERIRRDFLLRREEVKQIFKSFCREKTESQLDLGSRGNSDLRQVNTEWGKQLSQTLRRKSSIVTDGTLPSAGGNCNATGSPRPCTRDGRPMSARPDVADAAVEAAGNAAEPLGASERRATFGTEEAVTAVAGEDADRTVAQAQAPARVDLKGVTSSGARDDCRGSEEDMKKDFSLLTTGPHAATQKPEVPSKIGGHVVYIPVCVEDFQDILEKLDTHWGLEGRLLDIFRKGLAIPIAAEHADLIQYVLPQREGDLLIEDPEDVQPTEFWEFVKYYTEVHTGIRRELYNKRKRQTQVEPGANYQQQLVELLVKKKMVVLQEGENIESDDFEQPEKEKHEIAESSLVS